MLLQAVIAAFTVFSFCSNYGLAYNEESPNYKWSPRYLYGRRPSPTIYQIGSGIPQRVSPVNSKNYLIGICYVERSYKSAMGAPLGSISPPPTKQRLFSGSSKFLKNYLVVVAKF